MEQNIKNDQEPTPSQRTPCLFSFFQNVAFLKVQLSENMHGCIPFPRAVDKFSSLRLGRGTGWLSTPFL
jgi:hypothetical protein